MSFALPVPGLGAFTGAARTLQGIKTIRTITTVTTRLTTTTTRATTSIRGATSATAQRWRTIAPQLRTDTGAIGPQTGRGRPGAGAEASKAVVWPPNRGFHGNPTVTVLKPGTQVDRFGTGRGRFVAPNGTPVAQRSLAPGTTERPYSVFEVTNRLVVRKGHAEPWFGQPGMGIQYELPASVNDLLIAGYLRRLA